MTSETLLPCLFCGGDVALEGYSEPCITMFNTRGLQSGFRIKCKCNPTMQMAYENDAVKHWNTRAVPPSSVVDENVQKARTIIIHEAAALVRSDYLPSYYPEDWKIKVPRTVLKALYDFDEKHRQAGIRLKQAYDLLAAPKPRCLISHKQSCN